jgi:hypothetical protein
VRLPAWLAPVAVVLVFVAFIVTLVVTQTERSEPPRANGWIGIAPEGWERVVPLEKLAGHYPYPHAVTVGTVTEIKGADDGDFHIKLVDEIGRFIILEPVPQAMPTSLPRKGQRIFAWGITRWDGQHGWGELHPMWGWKPAGEFTGPTFAPEEYARDERPISELTRP